MRQHASARTFYTWVGRTLENQRDHLQHPAHYAEWEAQWGKIACPLLWSHGMYLVVCSLLEKHA